MQPEASKFLTQHNAGRISYRWIATSATLVDLVVGSGDNAMTFGSARLQMHSPCWRWDSGIIPIREERNVRSLEQIVREVEHCLGVESAPSPALDAIRAGYAILHRWMADYTDRTGLMLMTAGDNMALTIQMYGAMDMAARANPNATVNIEVPVSLTALTKQTGVSENQLLAMVMSARRSMLSGDTKTGES